MTRTGVVVTEKVIACKQGVDILAPASGAAPPVICRSVKGEAHNVAARPGRVKVVVVGDGGRDELRCARAPKKIELRPPKAKEPRSADRAGGVRSK